MARVILETVVHCDDCAKKIRKAVQNLPGVQRVCVSQKTGLVLIAGTADAWVLKRRIEHRLRRHVSIISDGAAPPENVYAGVVPGCGGWGANYWAPPPPQ